MSGDRPTWAEERARKQQVFRKMLADKTAMEAIKAEPELRQYIGQALAQKPGRYYSRVRRYYELKAPISRLVGDDARNPKLATSAHYDAVLRYMELLLPDDDLDLGIDPEDIEAEWED